MLAFMLFSFSGEIGALDAEVVDQAMSDSYSRIFALVYESKKSS